MIVIWYMCGRSDGSHGINDWASDWESCSISEREKKVALGCYILDASQMVVPFNPNTEDSQYIYLVFTNLHKMVL